MYRYFLRPIFFLFPPELIHHIVFFLIKCSAKFSFVRGFIKKIYQINDTRLERKFLGLTFKNPIGLAAGFDKDAKLFNELALFGFGFIEIGTLTPKAQEGNSKPRMFRLHSDEGLINRMGFNNDGAEAAVKRLRKRKTDIIIGGNIGKNKTTPNEEAAKDYEFCFNTLFDYVDYFVVNVSSPNTPNLRELQDREPLTHLLNKIQELNSKREKRKPVLLKIAPDLSNSQLDDIVDIVLETKIDGIIATNTTIVRDNLKTSKHELEKIGAGGVSGKSLSRRSTEVIRYLNEKSAGAFPIIGVGGIHSAEDAMEKLKAGASLIQIYTGFIYEGPCLVKQVNKAILKDKI